MLFITFQVTFYFNFENTRTHKLLQFMWQIVP